jgi:transcriptional accessory protein Tex/SPT6
MTDAAVEGDPELIEMARALHSHLPEDQRPVARMEFSDDQWARLEAAAAVIRAPLHSRLTKAEGENEQFRERHFTSLAKAAIEGARQKAEASQSEAAALRERVGELEKGLGELSVAVFGQSAGDEPDVYADYDKLLELQRRTAQLLKDNPNG